MHEPTLESNVRIGDFLIDRRIGAGGMGVVYQAHQVSLNRVVALKVLGGALNRESDIIRFQREAQAIARLQHPGIASVLFVGQDRQLCYMAMEFIDGVSLRQVIDHLAGGSDFHDSFGSLLDSISLGETLPPAVRFDEPTKAHEPTPEPEAPPDEAPSGSARTKRIFTSQDHIRRSCEIVRDAALALEHAHGRRVIHRDIKPENLMLDRRGEVHIIDFGVARYFEDQSVTDTGALVGTPMYMSPEQVTGRLDVDHRTDVYSLGLVLYELLLLRRPLLAPNREGILRQIVTKPLPPVAGLNRAVPRELEAVVHKATAKDPDERYQSASEFAADLRNYLDGRSVQAPPYRYRFDDSEIVSQRPGGITFVAGLFLLQALCGAFLCLKDAFQLAMFGNTVLIPSAGLIALFSALTAYWFYLAYGLISGRKSVNWQALGACLPSIGLSLYVSGRAMAEYEKFRNRDISSIYILLSLIYLGSAVLSTTAAGLLLRRRTRDWFRLAARLRAEHRLRLP